MFNKKGGLKMNITSMRGPVQTNYTNGFPKSNLTTPQLKKFLLKAKNGSLTKDDLQDMKTRMSTVPDDVFRKESDLIAFLYKVKSGTVSDSDLQKIKVVLNDASIKATTKSGDTFIGNSGYNDSHIDFRA
jgi:hypothetical protein